MLSRSSSQDLSISGTGGPANGLPVRFLNKECVYMTLRLATGAVADLVSHRAQRTAEYILWEHWALLVFHFTTTITTNVYSKIRAPCMRSPGERASLAPLLLESSRDSTAASSLSHLTDKNGSVSGFILILLIIVPSL
jgi:hypothetical protein